jgi:hypothetical protein
MSGSAKLLTAGGGGVNITPASSIASDVTVNVPSQNCTLGIQGPAFSAYASAATTCSNGASTKILLQSEEFDTNNNFDNVTNYRFTPTVAGYYQINGYISCGSTTGCYITIFKNGSDFKRGTQSETLAAQVGYVVTALIYFNGSSDYAELYFYNGSGSSKTTNAGSNLTYFQGALVRAA